MIELAFDSSPNETKMSCYERERALRRVKGK